MLLPKLVVFDLDGTLNKTELYAVPAHRKALDELGVTGITDEQILETFGSRGQDSTPALIGNSDPAAVDAYMRKVGLYEREFIETCSGSYEGIPEMLDRLRRDGCQTAVCSNASERYIRLVLEKLKLSDKIDHIQHLVEGLDKDGTLRLLLTRVKPEKALMVGDRVFDWNAARANGLPFIGCLYGFRPDEMSGADRTVAVPSEINAAVRDLIG